MWFIDLARCPCWKSFVYQYITLWNKIFINYVHWSLWVSRFCHFSIFFFCVLLYSLFKFKIHLNFYLIQIQKHMGCNPCLKLLKVLPYSNDGMFSWQIYTNHWFWLWLWLWLCLGVGVSFFSDHHNWYICHVFQHVGFKR